MSIENIKNALPEYAKDLKLNLSTLAREEVLNEQQLWGTFLACAIASRNAFVIENISAAAEDYLEEATENAAKAAAAIMGMNNIYYRFVHMASNKEYATMQAKLRMNVIGNPGVDKNDFELWSLAVSAINGCGMCIDSHESILLKHGMTKDQVQTAVRVAAVIHAIAVTLEGEQALQGSFAIAA